MKRTLIFLTALAVCACGKMDSNGDLGGNWQLDADTYFSIYTNMAQWRQISRPGTIYMSYFRQEGDSLFLTLHDGRLGMYRNDGSNDEPLTDAAKMPAALPVPANFAYRIQKVGADSLVLSAEGRTLRMRRY